MSGVARIFSLLVRKMESAWAYLYRNTWVWRWDPVGDIGSVVDIGLDELRRSGVWY